MEFELLSILRTRENFHRFKPYIKDTSASSYTNEIIKALEQYFNARTDVSEVDWSSFRSYFTVVLHPSMSDKDAKVYSRLFDRLQTEEPDEADVDELVKSLVVRDYCSRIVDEVLDNRGVADLSKLRELTEEALDEVAKATDDDCVSDDLEDIVNTYFGTDGFEWHLTEFNRAVGMLRPGDFIVLGARPEVGKTSFLLDVLRNILRQDTTDRPIMFFNNEEDSRKIILRMYSVVLNQSSVDIVRDIKTSQAHYAAETDDRFKAADVTGFDTNRIESLIRKHKPRAIVFNVLDKVQGFWKAGNETERLRHLAKWARDLGKKYDCVVFGILQADASAEGQMYPEQDQLYGSKTGIPGEADLLLMLGKSGDPKMDGFRYINICKNKLPGDGGTDPNLKHHKFALKFNATTGRYEDV